MIVMSAARRGLICLAVVLTALTGSACSSALDNETPRAGLACVDDSKHCIDQRGAALHAIMSDRDRKWVREPATPEAYASGVRLFAFKTRKRDLTCDELSIGQREADGAASVLRGPGAGGLSPAQVSRGMMLSSEVSRELATERNRRCRA